MNIGVIGVGRVGSNHARICTKLSNATLIGYCDIDMEKVNKISKLYNVKAFYDFKEMIKCVDAVIISTQTAYHYEIAKYCIENNIHVLIEKPITLLHSQGEELNELARSHNVILTVGHVERFNSAFENLHEIFNPSEVIGISVKRMSPMDYRVKDIDVVLDLMVHDIDIILTLMKGHNIVNINASGSIVRNESINVNHCDYAVAQIRFDNNVIVDLTASRVTEKKIRTLNITNFQSYIELDYMNKTLNICRNFKAETNKNLYNNIKYQQESIIQQVYLNTTESLLEEDQNFVNSIIGIENLRVKSDEGLYALKVANEIQKKIYKG